jgi:hypothetical protein
MQRPLLYWIDLLEKVKKHAPDQELEWKTHFRELSKMLQKFEVTLKGKTAQKISSRDAKGIQELTSLLSEIKQMKDDFRAMLGELPGLNQEDRSVSQGEQQKAIINVPQGARIEAFRIHDDEWKIVDSFGSLFAKLCLELSKRDMALFTRLVDEPSYHTLSRNSVGMTSPRQVGQFFVETGLTESQLRKEINQILIAFGFEPMDLKVKFGF